MKRVHAGGPRATSMESEAKNKDPKQRNQTALKSHLSTLHDSHSHEHVETMTRHFDQLVRDASVRSHDVGDWLLALSKTV